MSEAENKAGGASRPGEGESEASAGFRVIDRRRFAADGTERSESAPVESKPAEARPTTEPREETSRPRGGADFVMSDAGEPHSEALAEPTIGTLFLSLSTQALMHLGEIPDLATGESNRDLPAARSMIDLLALLEQKTRGNLDAAEAALLERILYDLRMRFVELARA